MVSEGALIVRSPIFGKITSCKMSVQTEIQMLLVRTFFTFQMVCQKIYFTFYLHFNFCRHTLHLGQMTINAIFTNLI